MKNLFLFAFSILFTTSAFSQNFLGMKILKYGLTATTDQDRVKNLDAQYFMNLSKDDVNSNFLNEGFTPKNLTSMTCENPAFKATVTVLPFNKFQNIQLDLGANVMFNRTDATEYRFNYFGEQDQSDRFHFSSHSHEIAIDAALLYNKKIKFINFYGGVGTNLGMTVGGYMNMSGTVYNEPENVQDGTDDPIEAEYEVNNFYSHGRVKNVLHQRVFAQGGMSVLILKRLELGLELRRGVGYRVNAGNGLRGTQLLSGGFTAKWNLK